MKKQTAAVCSILLSVVFAMPGYAKDLPSNQAAGFVQADGNKFVLDGKTFYYAGTNTYYLIYKSKEAVDNIMEDASDMGLKVIRTWGFLDVGTKTGEVKNGVPVFRNNADGEGQKDGVYFQYFDEALKKPVVNTGEDGLERLDYAIYKASQKNIKLLIAFTNNWKDFGGMEQYTKWARLVGENVNEHDSFYTNATIKQWYKDYVNTLLNHTNKYTGIKYKDDPSIFAWELANEPRANTDAHCQTGIVEKWADEMSSYVKSIDPKHMVALGDEGFYNYGYQDFPEGEYKYVYFGGEGTDYKKYISLPNIDFGTVHIYCDSWGLNENQAKFWLTKHAQDTTAADKPVILEEYGWKDRGSRDRVYTDWYKILEGETDPSTAYAGTNFWMLSSQLENGSLYPDYDQYTVYYRGDNNGNPTASTAKLIQEHAARMTAKNNGGVVVEDAAITPKTVQVDKAKLQDVVVNVTYKNNTLKGIQANGTDLVQGKDYKVEKNQVIISKDFLKNLKVGEVKLNFNFTSGRAQTLTVAVSDTTVVEKEAPKLAVTSANVDLNDVRDLTVAFTSKDYAFKGLTVNNRELVKDRDYTVNGNQVQLKKSYLETLQKGQTRVDFSFEGYKDTLALTLNVQGKTQDDKKNVELGTTAIDVDLAQVTAKDIKCAFNGNQLTQVADENGVLAQHSYVVGNDVITLKADYLKNLAAGRHTVTLKFNNGQALQVIVNVKAKETHDDSTIYYRPWSKGIIYNHGDIVYYEGKYWTAGWYTVNQKPGQNAVWTEYTLTDSNKPSKPYTPAPAGLYPDWDAATLYTGGEIVYVDGDYWKCKWWSNYEKPSFDNPYGPWEVYNVQ